MQSFKFEEDDHEDDAENDVVDDVDYEDEDEEKEDDEISFQPHTRVILTFLFIQHFISLCKPLHDGLHDHLYSCLRKL
jgi:hypothetical protein